MRSIGIFAAIFVLRLCCCGLVSAQVTHNAADCQQSTIQSLINERSVADGDTIQLPACNGVTWTSSGGPLTISKAVTLQGKPCSLDNNGRPVSCNTVIYDGVSGNPPLIQFNLAPNKTSRLSNIEFEDGGRRNNSGGSGGIISISTQTGSIPVGSRRIRIDHCRFVRLNDGNIRTRAYGVIDHNYFDLHGGTTIAVNITGQQDLPWSDQRWADPTGFGGENFLFIENNTFTRTTTTTPYALVDANSGARYVVRFNDIKYSWVEAHGTDSPGRARGARALEVYKNNFAGDNLNGTLVNLRSGSLIMFGNTATNYPAGAAAANLRIHRDVGLFQPWRGADGTSPWDVNDPGNPFATYTVTSVSGLTVTVSGAAWKEDQWKGYNIRKLNCAETNAISCHSEVVANNPTHISFSEGTQNNLILSAGDRFELNLITHAMDAPCRSGGALLTAKAITSLTNDGANATANVNSHGYSTGDYVAISDSNAPEYRGTYVITVTGGNTFTYRPAIPPPGDNRGFSGYATRVPRGWNNQVTEPCYQWSNTLDGKTLLFGAQNRMQIRINEHYFDYNPSLSFDGTIGPGKSGVGVGAGGNKPSACAAGTAYWATDEGDWNASGDGGQGRLYKCSAPNTWAPSYTPYRYPHPLTQNPR